MLTVAHLEELRAERHADYVAEYRRDVFHALQLAHRHLSTSCAMPSSAAVCYADAANAIERGDFKAARMWSLKSLAYSVGVFHSDYQAAKEGV